MRVSELILTRDYFTCIVSNLLLFLSVVIRTFWKHYFREARKLKNGEEWTAKDDLLFDEYALLVTSPVNCVLTFYARAFNIVKSFIELGTHNTVESLQAL